MVKPFLGRYGAIGIAAQTAVGTPADAPTLWLRPRQFLPPVPQRIWTDDEFADGTIFSPGSRMQGIQSDTTQLTFEPTLGSTAQMLAWMFGSVVAGTSGAPNTLTPRLDNFAALAPGTPLTIWQLHPVRNMIMQDAQITNLGLNVGSRATVEGSISIAATSRKEYNGAALTPLIPTEDVLQFLHFYAYFDGTKFRPKDGNITFEVPMEVQDGAQGEDEDNRLYPVGWERSGAVKATSRITVGAHDPMAALIASYDNGNPKVYKAGFHLGDGKDLELTIPKARVTTADPGNGLGLIDMPAEFGATYNGGIATFSFSKIPTL